MTQPEIRVLADEVARKALLAAVGDRVTERQWAIALDTAEFVLDLLINPPKIAAQE